MVLKPSVRLAVGHTTRTKVWAWTDASGEDPCLGVVVYARGSWYNTYLDIPPAVLDQLLHRQDSQINFLEMLAVLLFVTTFQDIICGTAAFVFIDNNSVLGSLHSVNETLPPKQDVDVCKSLAIFRKPGTAANYVGYVKWACTHLSMMTSWWSPTVTLTLKGMRAEHLRTTGGPALAKVFAH